MIWIYDYISIIIEFSSPKCKYVKYRNTEEYMFKNDYIPRCFDELYRPPAVVDMTSCRMKFDYRLWVNRIQPGLTWSNKID